MLELVQPQRDVEGATFADFWLLYPKRMAKKDAERAWAKLGEADRVAALTGLVTWRRVWLERDEMQYVPFPATWLNGERWTDELPAAASHASHVQAQMPTDKGRSEMPAHVRELIARLKK